MRLNWKPPRVFYGWVMVGAAFFISMYIGGAIFYGFTAVFEPIANDLGWSYTQISLAASIRGLEMGLLAPVIGALVDRWGPRRLMYIGAISTAIGLVLLSRTMFLAMFYISFVLITVGLSSCTQTVLMTALANWFRKKVGIASGVALAGFGFGGLLVPVVVRLIDMYEWRMAMVILAVGMLVIVVPLSLLFRHKPEQYGYLPDGETEDEAIPENIAASSQTTGLTVGARLALKSRIFWHLAVAFTIHGIILTSVITHVMPYLSSIGIARSTSSLVAAGIPLVSIVGRVSFGWLGDRIDRRRVATGAFVLISLGLLCFGYAAASGIWLLVLFLILLGIGYGGNNPLRVALAREFFGRRNFGAVFGLLMGINAIGSIAGPPLAGWVFDKWGSYQSIWFVFAGLAVVGIVALLTIPLVKASTELNDEV